jgi:hypothetical protein
MHPLPHSQLSSPGIDITQLQKKNLLALRVLLCSRVSLSCALLGLSYT